MINVYEGIKGVKKVKSLQPEDLTSNASNLGALPSGVTVLLTESHVEFSVALEGKRATDDVFWLGFHFSASFQKFQKVFSKSLPNLTFEQTSALLHKSLISQFEDPYASPLYITGANGSKAYWTVSLADHPNVIYGHIPLHRSDSYHTLQAYPILSLEGDMQVIIGTDIDRNQLYPAYPKIDACYTQTLHNIDPILQTLKWSANVIPTIKTSPSPSGSSAAPAAPQTSEQLITKNQFDLEKLARWFLKKFNPVNPLTFVYGMSFYKKGSAKTIDMITLKTSPNGKTFVVNLVQTFRLTPSLDFFKDLDGQKRFEEENLPTYMSQMSELEKDCQTIKNLVPSTSVSIYNPFFDRHYMRTNKCPAPLTVESSFLASHPMHSSTSSSSSQTHEVESPRTPQASSSTSTSTSATTTPRSKQQQHQHHSSSKDATHLPSPTQSQGHGTTQTVSPSINVDQALLAQVIGQWIKEHNCHL
ncbi:hypothetical protein SAMD00019534_117760 [Acytostelium subglobosum LB1]|uniref:hypothetical protein n=1 Tax=Acytostelium subglobosum LB1 TaxID=1410327 RepID=UPI000644FD72|nr:hypothetical protein SAMD00019534_117760 [Acytostelium subglobosum LB1]GAM28600.1 hypothetical protein SAMD00019534_117760 [Acytostelium subglobosum LB1]|eukprot:XP_012748378.1 hypothetical protein SAMD00019534_117760 [Acytostelium subglobosum LB1]